MGLNDTPSANRVHIGFFGRRNAGKSSLVNAVTGQSLAVVSEVAGTTTDPVYKSMELLPLGPVVIIDTPGVDDEGSLGEQRVAKTRQVLGKTDVAVLVVDGTRGPAESDRELVALFREKNINYIIAYNKCDLVSEPEREGLKYEAAQLPEVGVADEKNCSEKTEGGQTESKSGGEQAGGHIMWVSARCGMGIHELKEMLGRLTVTDTMTGALIGDLISPGDMVVLVIPIDSAAPKGRLILPQQQVIRDVLEAGAVAVVCRDTELADTLERLSGKVSLVVTDSQAFAEVMKIVPEDILLTSFSILMARFKGQLKSAVAGAYTLDELAERGGRVLISEGCTHHRQCDDIGTVKLPRWIDGYTGQKLEYEFTSGTEFPDDLTRYDLIIHCGGCMLNGREMKSRAARAAGQNVPMTNYGTAIAHMNGILERSLEVFKQMGICAKNEVK